VQLAGFNYSTGAATVYGCPFRASRSIAEYFDYFDFAFCRINDGEEFFIKKLPEPFPYFRRRQSDHSSQPFKSDPI